MPTTSAYWRIQHHGRVLHVLLAPPGDLQRLDLHYPGCSHHVAMSFDDWKREIGDQKTETATDQQVAGGRKVPYRPPFIDIATLNALADQRREEMWRRAYEGDRG